MAFFSAMKCPSCQLSGFSVPAEGVLTATKFIAMQQCQCCQEWVRFEFDLVSVTAHKTQFPSSREVPTSENLLGKLMGDPTKGDHEPGGKRELMEKPRRGELSTSGPAMVEKGSGMGYQRQANGTDDDYYHAGGLDPWTLEKAMQPTGNVFIDARRTDVIEYAFRLKGFKQDKVTALRKLKEDLTKAGDNARAAANHIDFYIGQIEAEAKPKPEALVMPHGRKPTEL